jgi:hypothetical protein
MLQLSWCTVNLGRYSWVWFGADADQLMLQLVHRDLAKGEDIPGFGLVQILIS